jgi:hypothetical protein
MLKKIMNLPEKVTHSRLKIVCKDYGASVCPKIRLADVFPIKGSGISNNEYRFALQAHFDFLITDNNFRPLFAVEFDGFSHHDESQKQKDEIKNRLCDLFGLPLLRINSNHLYRKYRNMDLLSWFVEVWFLAEGFYETQQKGGIPYDEPFDPFHLNLSDKEITFPLSLSIEILPKIEVISKTGNCKDLRPSSFIGIDAQDNYRGIAYIRINDNMGVYVESGLRNQNFLYKALLAGDLELILSDLLTEILINELWDKLLAVVKSKKSGTLLNEIYESYKKFSENVKYCCSSTVVGGKLTED